METNHLAGDAELREIVGEDRDGVGGSVRGGGVVGVARSGSGGGGGEVGEFGAEEFEEGVAHLE